MFRSTIVCDAKARYLTLSCLHKHTQEHSCGFANNRQLSQGNETVEANRPNYEGFMMKRLLAAKSDMIGQGFRSRIQ
jgi:hypothetical protein